VNVAGAKGRVRFQEKSVSLLHSATSGVPRLVNLCADRSLLAAYTEQTRSIGESHVRQALAALRGEEGIDSSAGVPSVVAAAPRTLSSRPARAPRRWLRPALASAGTLALL